MTDAATSPTRADLHVHSRYSEHPSDWFLQRLGARESYTEPEAVYQAAKRQGMDFVTLTDHNRIEGALQLVAAHPEDSFTGLEATTYLPETGAKAHILIWDLDAAQFAWIQEARTDARQLSRLLRSEGLPHAIAHLADPVNSRTTLDDLERLLALFDGIETKNGARPKWHNETCEELFRRLSPARNALLATGGSDDHAGLFVGRTWTEADATTRGGFIDRLRRGMTRVAGRDQDQASHVFGTYKTALDFARARGRGVASTPMAPLLEALLAKDSLSWIDRLTLAAAVSSQRWRGDRSASVFYELLEGLGDESARPSRERFRHAYDRLANATDPFLADCLLAIERAFEQGDLTGVGRALSDALPTVFLTVPCFRAVGAFHRERATSKRLLARFGGPPASSDAKLLWFTDTLTDLNGVSITLRELGRRADSAGRRLTLVTSLAADQVPDDLPANVINLPYVREFELPHYESYRMKLPSIMRSLALLSDEGADRVWISTPGPVGLLGLLFAKLAGLPTTGVYHTDFGAQARAIVDDDSLSQRLDVFERWFYTTVDRIAVPTREYARILESRGCDPGRMRLFPRGVDTTRFAPRRSAARAKGFALLYAGRISRDKGLDLVVAAYEALLPRHPDLRLVFCGDGPYLEPLRARCHGLTGVRFTGRVSHDVLADLYSSSDLLVFPSATDTFGMTVLEAQASGLPVVVTDLGGPQEVIAPGETGWIARAGSLAAWRERLEEILTLAASRPADYATFRARARARVLERHAWPRVLQLLWSEGGGEHVSFRAPTAASAPSVELNLR